MEDTPSFQLNGKSYNLPTDLTMGEMCDAENFFGVEFGNTERSGARMAAALIYIAVHRVDPSVTPEDIRDLPTDVFESMGADAGPPEPSVNSDEPAGSNGTSGLVSVPTGDGQDSDPSSTGNPGSGTGSTYAPATSAS